MRRDADRPSILLGDHNAEEIVPAEGKISSAELMRRRVYFQLSQDMVYLGSGLRELIPVTDENARYLDSNTGLLVLHGIAVAP